MYFPSRSKAHIQLNQPVAGYPAGTRLDLVDDPLEDRRVFVGIIPKAHTGCAHPQGATGKCVACEISICLLCSHFLFVRARCAKCCGNFVKEIARHRTAMHENEAEGEAQIVSVPAGTFTVIERRVEK